MTDVGKDTRSESKALAIEADWVSEISKCKTEGQRRSHFGNSSMVMGKEGCIKKKGKKFPPHKRPCQSFSSFRTPPCMSSTLLELMELKDGGRADKWRGACNTGVHREYRVLWQYWGGNVGGSEKVIRKLSFKERTDIKDLNSQLFHEITV